MELKIKLEGDWKKAMSGLADGAAKFDQAAAKAVHNEAKRFEEAIQKAFDTGGASSGKKWAPLSKSRLFDRGGSGDPLVDTGTLRNSIGVKEQSGMKAWVGVVRGGKAKSGKSVHEIAAIHENGATFAFPMTEKMRKFLAVKAKKMGKELNSSSGAGSGSTLVIVVKIPKRSFLVQTFEYEYKNMQAVERRVMHDLTNYLGGIWRQ